MPWAAIAFAIFDQQRARCALIVLDEKSRDDDLLSTTRMMTEQAKIIPRPIGSAWCEVYHCEAASPPARPGGDNCDIP